jgi:hypothetical protein
MRNLGLFFSTITAFGGFIMLALSEKIIWQKMMPQNVFLNSRKILRLRIGGVFFLAFCAVSAYWRDGLLSGSLLTVGLFFLGSAATSFLINLRKITY